MSGIDDVLKDIEHLEKTPEGHAYDLRLDLSEIVLRHLDGKHWTQNQLAKAAGMRPQVLTRIIHAASNCTFETAGRILFALGIKARLVEAGEVREPVSGVALGSGTTPFIGYTLTGESIAYAVGGGRVAVLPEKMTGLMSVFKAPYRHLPVTTIGGYSQRAVASAVESGEMPIGTLSSADNEQAERLGKLLSLVSKVSQPLSTPR